MTRRLLTNCSIIRCDGTAPIQDGAVLVDEERIQAVDRQSALAPLLGPDVETLDLGGRWLMPGLMNMHVHLALALPGPTQLAAKLETDMALTLRVYRNALDALHAGVTFVRTVGEPRGVDFELRRAINSGQIQGPRMFCAGRAVIITGGHGFDNG